MQEDLITIKILNDFHINVSDFSEELKKIKIITEKSLNYEELIIKNDFQWNDLSEKFPKIKKYTEENNIFKNAKKISFLFLSAESGQFQKHTDPELSGIEYGISDKKITRFHIPLATSEKIFTTCWDIFGNPNTSNFLVGNVYYVDVRKPHAISNYSNENRIHLSVDVISTPEIYKKVLYSPDVMNNKIDSLYVEHNLKKIEKNNKKIFLDDIIYNKRV